MEYRFIFFSALDVWSMKEGVGAPSFYNTLELYAKKGHEVFLIKPSGYSHKEYSINGVKILTFNQDIFDKLKSKRCISFFARILLAIYQKKRYYSIAKKLIDKKSVNCVLYAYEVSGVSAAKKLHEKYNVPFITRFQGTILQPITDNWINRLKRYPHFQALSEESNLVIMTDDGTLGDQVLNRLGNKSKQICFWKNGVSALSLKEKYDDNDIASFRFEYRNKYKISDKTFVLMTLCRLAKWKRIDRAITALKSVINVNSNVKLIVVGEGDEKENLVQLCKEMEIENFVVFAGGAVQEETPKYYSMCDCFLSLYDLSNVGNPLLEALVYGKPIITLDTGNTSEVITDGYNGILIPVEQVDEIGNKILELIEDKRLQERLAKGAKEYSENNLWTWEKRMETEYNVVMKVVEEYNKTRNGVD